MNNRALSSIVSTILIIAISATLAIGFGYALTTTAQIALAPETTCTQAQIENPISIVSTEFMQDSNELKVSLNRLLTSYQINSMEFILESESEDERWTCSRACGACEILSPGITKRYSLSTDSIAGKSLVVKINGCIVSRTDF